jgi:uncharacterized protein (UPF0332 family)
VEKERNLKEIIEQLISRGEEKLESAQILLRNKRFDDAISRSYYAAYLAARAALLMVGEEPKTHSGTLTLIGLRLIKPKLAPEEIGRSFTELFEARQTSDYSVISYYTQDDAKRLFDSAEKILVTLKTLIKETLK